MFLRASAWRFDRNSSSLAKNRSVNPVANFQRKIHDDPRTYHIKRFLEAGYPAAIQEAAFPTKKKEYPRIKWDTYRTRANYEIKRAVGNEGGVAFLIDDGGTAPPRFVLQTMGKGPGVVDFANQLIEEIKPTFVLARLNKMIAPVFEVPGVQSPFLCPDMVKQNYVTNKRNYDVKEQEEIEATYYYQMIEKKMMLSVFRGNFVPYWMHQRHFFDQFPFPVSYETAAVAKLANFKGIKTGCEERPHEVKLTRYLSMAPLKYSWKAFKESRQFLNEQKEEEDSGEPQFDIYLNGPGDRTRQPRDPYVQLMDFEEDVFFINAFKRNQANRLLGVVDYIDEETLIVMIGDSKDRTLSVSQFNSDTFDILVEYFDSIHSFEYLKTERQEREEEERKKKEEEKSKRNDE